MKRSLLLLLVLFLCACQPVAPADDAAGTVPEPSSEPATDEAASYEVAPDASAQVPLNEVAFARNEMVEPYVERAQEEALLTGTLAIVDGCVAVTGLPGYETVIVVWPPEYLMQINDERVQIVDFASGDQLAMVGDEIAVGGGFHRADDARKLARTTLPERCITPYGESDAFFFASPTLTAEDALNDSADEEQEPVARQQPTVMPVPLATPLAEPAFITGTTAVTNVLRVERADDLDAPVLETEHFVFYVQEMGGLPAAASNIDLVAEEVYRYVEERLLRLSQGPIVPTVKTEVVFAPPIVSDCPARGLASGGEPPRITIFADETITREQILGVLAHEVGHILHGVSDVSGGHRPLGEGLATWASEDYWTPWQQQTSIDDAVRGFLLDAVYLPLFENYDFKLAYGGEFNLGELLNDGPQTGESCLIYRDILYVEWASFTGFLLEEHGAERLRALFATPASVQQETNRSGPQRANFTSVYGETLQALELQWLRHLVDTQ